MLVEERYIALALDMLVADGTQKPTLVYYISSHQTFYMRYRVLLLFSILMQFLRVVNISHQLLPFKFLHLYQRVAFDSQQSKFVLDALLETKNCRKELLRLVSVFGQIKGLISFLEIVCLVREHYVKTNKAQLL